MIPNFGNKQLLNNVRTFTTQNGTWKGNVRSPQMNTFDDSTTLPLSQAEDKKQEKVKCPYCDFEFEEFSSDAFSEHLRTVHCITKSLDILLEFSLNTIKKGNKQIRDVCVDVS